MADKDGNSGEASAAPPLKSEDLRRIADELRRAGRKAAMKSFFIIAAVAMALIALLVFLIPQLLPESDWGLVAQYAVVALVAGLVGYGELVSRYRDSPAKLFGAPSTPVYVLVNATAAIAALAIIKVTKTLSSSADPPWLFQIMLAAFGAIAFFRTSLFTVRVGETDIGIGPSAMLQSLLNAADRMVDRNQAEVRASRSAVIMRSVDHTKASAALSLLCIVLMQNPDRGELDNLGRQLEALDKRKDVSAEQKAVILGVYLIRLVGADVLERAVKAFGTLIEIVPPPPPQPLSGHASPAPPPQQQAAQTVTPTVEPTTSAPAPTPETQSAPDAAVEPELPVSSESASKAAPDKPTPPVRKP